MSRFFKPVSSGWATVILSLATLLSYAMGLVRDLMLSYYFGASAEMDAYNTAFLIPDLIFNFTIAAALASVFLPTFREVYLKDKAAGEKLASAFLVSSQILVIIVSVIAFVFMPWLVEIMFGHADIEVQKNIIEFSRILLLSPIVFGISNTLGVVAMSFKHYLSYALSPGIYNLGIILGILLWGKNFGVMGAIYGVVLGLSFHLGVRFLDLRKLESFKFKFYWYHPALKEIFLTSLPRSFGLMVWQVNNWIYNVVGYSMVVGSIAAFNYARNLQSFAVSLFGISVATAVFPYLVDHKSLNQVVDLKDRIQNTFLQILVYTVPSAVGLFVLNYESVQFLFGRGEFAEQGAVLITSGILMYLVLAIPFESLTHLLSRIYYAHKNTWTPVLVNFLFLAINLFMCLYFASKIGPEIFGISFFVGSLVQTLLLAGFLYRYIMLDWGKLLLETFKLTFFAIVMGIVVFQLKFLPFLIVILIGVLVYGALLWPTSLRKYTGIEHLIKKFK